MNAAQPEMPKAGPIQGDAPLSDAARWNVVDNLAPRRARPYLRLARIDRPIGWWLLLLPCWWSSLLASDAAGQSFPNIAHLALFFVGAIVMRGAGSTYNDILDRNLDAKVTRTKNRPLPSGAVTVRGAVLFLLLQALIGLTVLLQFNTFAIAVGFASLAPVAVYPLMKRITSFPQAVLGLAFAWGGLMGWAAVFGRLDTPAFLIYAAAIVWTFGYDTIYALQDIEDDPMAGIKSTARFFGRRSTQAIRVCFILAVILIALALYAAGAGPFAYLGLMAFAGHLAWQVRSIVLDDPQRALRLFRSNRDAGLLLAAGLAIDIVARAALL